jgi:hypothetical protein
MTKPLLITDCDDVLLYMLTPFGEWLDKEHDIEFRLVSEDYANSMRRRQGDPEVGREEMWELLRSFFDGAMHTQPIADHAHEALRRISEEADIVVLTNLEYHRQQDRVDQLAKFGIHFPVYCNQGPKGPRVLELLEKYQPSVAVFVDDLGFHHQSVAEVAPAVWRLHMHVDPDIAPTVPPSEHAHHRIDDWLHGRQWVLDRMRAGLPADHRADDTITA